MAEADPRSRAMTKPNFIDRAQSAVRADLNSGAEARQAHAEDRATQQAARAEHERAMSLEDHATPLVAQGWRIESQLPNQIVLVSGKRVNHVLHLLLTLVTFGLWSIVWIIVGVTGGERRRVLTREPDGSVSARKG
jgi:Na+-transporting NADH:ubiquinone oxidoreductase subunit NqrC